MARKKAKTVGDNYEVLVSFVDLVLLRGYNKSAILELSEEQIKRYGGYVKLKSTPMTPLEPSTPVEPAPEPPTGQGVEEQVPAKK